MKSILRLLAATACLTLSLNAQNVLTNPSFEDKIPKPTTRGCEVVLLNDWRLLLNGGEKRCAISVEDDALTGKHSLRLHTLGEQGFCGATHRNRFPVVPGQEITASVMMKGHGSGYIRIYYIDANGKTRHDYKMMGKNATDKWDRLLLKFAVPDGVQAIAFALETLRHNADILFDDAFLDIAHGDCLENKFLKVTFNPSIGGGIDSLTDKADKYNYTKPRVLGGDSGGLLNIVLPARRMPGAVMEMPFQRTAADGVKNVYSGKIISGEMAGLEITREYKIANDAPRLDATLRITNTSGKTMAVNYRIQNTIDGANGTYSWPTPDWVTIFTQGKPLNGLNAIEHTRFRAGWMAKHYEDNGTALVFNAPVADIQKMYTYLCPPPGIGTIEWYCPEIKLAPGQSREYTHSIQLLRNQTTYYADELGRRQKSEKIEPVKLPEPPRQSPLPPQFQDFFPYGTGTGNLNQPEMAGSDTYLNTLEAYRTIEPRLDRELVDAYFSNIHHFRLIYDFYLKTQRQPDGTYTIGELAKKYHLKLLFSTLFLFRKDTDSVKYMAETWPNKLKQIDTPECREFSAKYGDSILAIFTGDELIPQNLPVLLRVHQELKRLLPEHIIPFPYLNSSTLDLLPYLPVFLGDWYPINRKEASGRNPWNVYGEYSKIVKIAGDKPVWFMPQGFGTAETYAFPTAGETRLMLHLAAAAGVKGIIWHGFPSGGWHWMMNYYMYRYSPLGGAGQLTPTWEGVVDGGRTFATVGALLTRCKPVAPPADVKISAGSYRSPNGFYDGPDAKIFALKAPRGTVIIAINQNPYGHTQTEITLPAKYFDFQQLAFQNPGTRKIALKPGDAAYFCLGTDWDELKPSLKSRFRAEAARYVLLADQAKGENIPVVDPFALETDTPMESLAKVAQAREKLLADIAKTPLDAVLKDLAAVKAELDRIDFKLCKADALVIPPEVKKNTPLYRRWAAHPDPVFQDAKTRLVKAFSLYFRLQDAVNAGKGSKAASTQLPELKDMAEKAIADVDKWLDNHPDKDKIDDPYMGME